MNSLKYNVTTDEILRSFDKEKKKLTDPKFKRKVLDEIQSQKDQETQLIKSFEACPHQITSSKILPHLSSLDPEELKQDVNNNFYNNEVMKAALCISGSLYVDQGPFALSNNERIREYITDLHQIGAESVSGFALSGNFSNSMSTGKDFFVVKAPRNPKDEDELIHESVVALVGTNQLRNIVPNYAYVYGVFKCSPIYVGTSEDKEVLSWCNSTTGGNVAYSMYENIAPARSFSDFVKTCTPLQFMEYYIQTMMALRVGQEKYGFVHYDLHTDNVLLRKTGKGRMYIPYPTPEGERFIKSEGEISTIIDYGMSHIEVDNKHYGYVGANGPMEMYGVYRSKNNPLFDAYKLLGMSLIRMYGRGDPMVNPQAFDAISPMLRFFNTEESPIDIVIGQNDTYYALPFNKFTSHLTMTQWIDYCRLYVISLGGTDPIIVSPPEDSLILRCSKGCLSFTQEMDKVGIDLSQDTSAPRSFLEFHDSYGIIAEKAEQAYHDSNSSEEDKWVKVALTLTNQFIPEFPEAFHYESQRLEYLSNDLNIKKINNLPPKLDQLIDDNVLAKMKISVDQSIRFLDSYQRIALSIQSMGYIQQIYNVDDSHDLTLLINKYVKILNDKTPARNVIVRVLKGNIEFLDPTNDNTRNFLKILRSNERNSPYLWYWSIIPSVTPLLGNIVY